MKLSSFDYELPKELVAQYPPKKRGDTRLMVLDRQEKSIQHKKYADIPDFISENDVVVLNDTRVIRARIYARNERNNKEVQVLLLNSVPAGVFSDTKLEYWYALIGRAKNVELGDELEVNKFCVKVIDRKPDEKEFIVGIENSQKLIDYSGHVPLPPYIKRDDSREDRYRYNTIFARHDGSVASPTASLNITEELLERINQKGAKVCYVNLQIGLGTFGTVDTENIEDYKIHREHVEIPPETVDLVNNCKGKVWAFGTTVTRSLESAAVSKGKIRKFSGETSLFIFPGYDFKIVDALVTNFHMPRTSLVLLVSAFAGRDLVMKSYQEAVLKKYMFLSYGDSMLIL